jgi:hypothetical protein
MIGEPNGHAHRRRFGAERACSLCHHHRHGGFACPGVVQVQTMEGGQQREKKAPVVVEVMWILSFIATLDVFLYLGFGPVGVAFCLFLSLSFRIVLVMIYDKFNPDWETDGPQVGVPGLEERLKLLNRYALNGCSMKRWPMW